MPRSNEEWVGKNDDQAIPERVRLRIFEREGRKCQICGGDIRPGDGIDYHHVPPLADGGRHAEFSIFPVHRKCHRLTTAKEALQRAETRATVKKHYGIKQTGKGWSTGKQSKWKKKLSGEIVPR